MCLNLNKSNHGTVRFSERRANQTPVEAETLRPQMLTQCLHHMFWGIYWAGAAESTSRHPDAFEAAACLSALFVGGKKILLRSELLSLCGDVWQTDPWKHSCWKLISVTHVKKYTGQWLDAQTICDLMKVKWRNASRNVRWRDLLWAGPVLGWVLQSHSS